MHLALLRRQHRRSWPHCLPLHGRGLSSRPSCELLLLLAGLGPLVLCVHFLLLLRQLAGLLASLPDHGEPLDSLTHLGGLGLVRHQHLWRPGVKDERLPCKRHVMLLPCITPA